jgi:hypothetical protein
MFVFLLSINLICLFNFFSYFSFLLFLVCLVPSLISCFFLRPCFSFKSVPFFLAFLFSSVISFLLHWSVKEMAVFRVQLAFKSE